MEVFVGEDADGNPTYTVGGTTINAAAGAHSRTVDGQDTITGLMKSMNPMRDGFGEVSGRRAVEGDDDPVVPGSRVFKPWRQVCSTSAKRLTRPTTQPV